MDRSATASLPALAAAVVALAWSSKADAGAWPMSSGATQLILGYDLSTAVRGTDDGGQTAPIPHRREEDLSLFVESGLTTRLTLQGRLGWTRGADGFLHFEGRGPTQLGVRYAAWAQDRSVVSVYVGAIAPGEGRNAGYAAPRAGRGDLEVRLLGGTAFRLRRSEMFAEFQAARLFRSGLPDETRLDLTLGERLGPRWLCLLKSYTGAADRAPAAMWSKVEFSLVRRLGPWSVQGGWRATLAGRAVPLERGPIIALWRRF